MKKLSLLSFLALALLVLFSCSREKGITVNPLLEKKPVMFILRDKPADVQKFVDSVSALAADSVHFEDTVTATINDTVWLVGHFGGKAEAIASYAWKLSNDSVYSKRSNNDLLGVAFADTGHYQARYVLVDKINGRDSAGTKQWIRIINTIPWITLPSDTIKARAQGPANFTFTAQDSAGRIVQVKLDYNLDGTWDTTYAWNGGDLIDVSAPRDSSHMDSLGNQNMAMAVTDDDGNTVTDTVVLHFNRIPVLTLDYPLDSSKVSIFERFAFYWHADDSDNPKDLRYSLRVAKVPVLTSSHTVIANTRERSWQQIDANGALTDTSLHGNLYWQVIATDGLDTVYSPTRKFFLGDPNVKFGTISGVALMQGQQYHNGIRLTLVSPLDGSRLITHTEDRFGLRHKGTFKFSNVEPGCYRIEARDTVDYYYVPKIVEDVCVDLGETNQLDTILLEDHSGPHVSITSILDPLYLVRNVTVQGTFGDSGSQVDTLGIKAYVDETLVAMDSSSQYFWRLKLSGLSDGTHTLRIEAPDQAGNASKAFSVTFAVKATHRVFTVNGKHSVVVLPTDPLSFDLSVTNAVPVASSVLFQLNSGQGTPYELNESGLSGKSAFTWSPLTPITFFADGLPRVGIAGTQTAAGVGYTDTVTYLVREPGKAAILFTDPSKDTTVTKNDVVLLLVDAAQSDGIKSQAAADTTFSFDGGAYSHLPYPYSFASATLGSHTIVARLIDTCGVTVTTSVKVTILAQPPTVIANRAIDTVKINSPIPLDATGSDIAPGTIAKYEWNCGTAGNPGAWIETASAASAALSINAPDVAGHLLCVVRATDNDDEIGLDTIQVLVKQDLPYVRVMTKTGTVTIRDSLKLDAQAKDTMGVISSIEWSCGLPGFAGVSGWKTFAQTSVLAYAPKTAASAWLCVIRVTDNDGQTAMDTTTYTVLLDPPVVHVIDKNLNVAINAAINLDAIAWDGLGRIIRYEWGCGDAGISVWHVTATPQTTVQAPSVGSSNYICAIRVMDDDSLVAMDTTFILVDQALPTVTVARSEISVHINDPISLGCTTNDRFGTLFGYRWSCGPAGVAGTSGSTWDPANGYYQSCNVAWTAPSTGTANYLCVVQVADINGQFAYDTTNVIVVQPPVAIVTSTNKLPVWSGDFYVPDTNKFWHHTVSGAASQIGQPLGDVNNKEFWWNFSNYTPAEWFKGPSDGTIDISYEGFADAFQRPNSPATYTLKLDFRDSIAPAGVTDPAFLYDFLIRHLSYAQTSVSFYRAWVGVGPDTVMAVARRPMAMVASDNGAYVAYRDSSTGDGYVRNSSGGAWSVIGGGSFGSNVDTVRMAWDPVLNDLYVAYRDNSDFGHITVKKSLGATGAWAVVGGGNAVPNGGAKRIALAARNGKVAVAWVDAYDSMSFTALNGASWNASAARVASIADVKTVLSTNGDTLALGYATISNTAKLRRYRGAFTSLDGTTSIYGTAANSLSLVYSNGNLYAGLNDYSSPGGPLVRTCALKTYTSWSTVGTGIIGQHTVGTGTAIAIDVDGNPILAYDDNPFAPQTTVWKYNGTAWKLLGENLLPHFAAVFYATHGYYLRGPSPQLAVSPNGSVYVGMLAKSSGPTVQPFFGPLVMKYTP